MPRINSSMVSLGLATLLAGCTSDASQLRTVERPAASQRCIALDHVAGRQVAASSLIFEMSSGIRYRNDFVGNCPGLDRLAGAATVSVASGGDGGRLCRGDRVRVMDPVEAHATGALNQPSCILGDFRAEPR